MSDVSNVRENINLLKKQRDDKKHERKLLATDYENQKEKVKKSGITALITLLVQYAVLLPLAHYKKSVTLMGLGRSLSPIALLIFVVSFVYFLIKGFDFFVNADTKYSRILANKFNINPISDELKIMNEAITMLDIEIDKLENEIYESGEDFTVEQQVAEPNITKITKKTTANKVVRKTSSSESNIEKKKNDKYEDKNKDNKQKNNIDDIFSGLDDFILDDDEFESSSDMWENDAKRRFSKY